MEISLLYSNSLGERKVFFFKIVHKDQKWVIRRSWEQFETFNIKLNKKGSKEKPQLPKYNDKDTDLYLRLTVYLRKMIEIFKPELNSESKPLPEWKDIIEFIEG